METRPDLLSLPDDALLAVLAFLPARTLFACRVACRRLRDLCLHRHLWRSVCVESLGVLRAATAALVPCIGRISLDVPLRSTAALLKDTACVVRALELAVQNSQDAALASTLLSEVSAVGGATELVLLIKCRRPNALQPLLKAVWDRRGLLTLDVTNNSRRPLPSDWCETVGVPSLTRLRYDSPSADPFLELLLRTHAATLQHVELQRLEDVPASLLAHALQLRSLKCSPCEGLSQLVDLPDLSSIDLSHEGESNCHCLQATAAFPRGTLAFLTEASHLRSVTLCVFTEDSEAPLRALSLSPSAANIENLVALAHDQPESYLLGEIAPFLSSFRSLRTLIVEDEPVHEFLEAVSPAALPCLTTLKFCIHEDSCMHGTLHTPGVHDLLIRNPRLHVYNFDLHVVCCGECPWCRWGCHEPLKGTANREVCYSSHSKSASCPEECFQAFSPSYLPYPRNN
ncbi:uncharacterized protein LOC117651858 [Thrips palmi]|uniref:Uncharacterized protein LOC117651858 n=1 Tax=Thrips palmi TaxID=161013 RepID=A0A6P9A2Z9_THRPL|nr:uncharacterized protein LOC117651858 [Thrips palmi]XP_034252222.1 uncharacterized protein LOC117651858 [Thrips palmi]XP_034252223.1 uncharacterized protein LOC117651858 [Thrips palmi]XP_034252224.1 uncharacterized protein LOC117651858 [Thrips palmi]XP_034252225.1 uncharacterized protein LOC117651858 [Thrips palmi]XP_034252226.1 uncharacterized protein LOC117651858 [Thrips palmi]XP_034252228.1 uncharacterized protein LOC117651858 [Thrips palmi]XP_034252229.1 uncharacterized protein LOC1176